MFPRNPRSYLVLGLTLSVAALVLGALMLPFGATEEERSLALLYKLSLSEVPRAHESAPRESGKAIVADLSMMQLSLIENGALIDTFAIRSKGRPGTGWETPTGLYQVQTREQKHFSSIGGVWMPYSMQFYGNFFIHGWPYYPDGKQVAEGYSGGCIRLSTDDAAEVFAFADRGTPVYVRGGTNETATSSRYWLSQGGTLPEIKGKAIIAADLETGAILWERASDEALPLHELASAMTALVALENVNQYKWVRMGELMLGKPVSRKEETGELDEVPIGALVHPLVWNGNAMAGKAFALDIGTAAFVGRMNEKARAIGLEETTFFDPSPTAENRGTARDMFLLLQRILENKRYLLDVALAKEKVVAGEGEKERFSWQNRNAWVVEGDARYRGGFGGAWDNTDARSSFAGVFVLPLSEFGDRKIAIIVLDSPDVKGDIDRVRDFVLDHYVFRDVPAEVPFVIEHRDRFPLLWGDLKDTRELERMIRSSGTDV